MSDFQSVGVGEVPADARILDVREDDEWAAGHIKGAVHVPLGEIPTRFSELDQDAQWFVTCKAGGRSARACAWLAGNGMDVVNVDGGMMAWDRAGYPMAADSGTPTVL